MATILHDQPQPDPIHAAIARHRAAYDAFQVAPEGILSIEANDEYDAASDALVSTACASRFGALALLGHLRWWLKDEAEFRAGHEPAYSLAEARAADLTLFLGTPLPPALRPATPPMRQLYEPCRVPVRPWPACPSSSAAWARPASLHIFKPLEFLTTRLTVKLSRQGAVTHESDQAV
ncbi:hypothetical protein [Methylobacterium planeticum]|uniref:hypothetical protein n=1 Tax=Methylobacterium planeticum TaxID=2615211 RepID=UPI001FEF3FF6|nr:hypothetical protein [Methylobacterium planeticum]